MGKRYGRNQKRRHRERIADLETQNRILQRSYEYNCAMANKLAGEVVQLRRELEFWRPAVSVSERTERDLAVTTRVTSAVLRHARSPMAVATAIGKDVTCHFVEWLRDEGRNG